MNTLQSLTLILEAINLAQSRGAYNLKESATILPAVETLTNLKTKMTMEENETIVTTPEVEQEEKKDETETPVETVENSSETGIAEPVPEVV